MQCVKDIAGEFHTYDLISMRSQPFKKSQVRNGWSQVLSG
jgi:hypothetical protein